MAVRTFLLKMCESQTASAAEQDANNHAENGVLFHSLCDWFPREVHRSLNVKTASVQMVRQGYN